MPYKFAVCTVKNSWWWTEKLSEHVEFYSKNWEICASSSFYYKNPFTNCSNYETANNVVQRSNRSCPASYKGNRPQSLLSEIPLSNIYSQILYNCGPGSSAVIASDYGLDSPGSNPGRGEIFRPSRPNLGPTQPPVKWVPSLSREQSGVRACC